MELGRNLIKDFMIAQIVGKAIWNLDHKDGFGRRVGQSNFEREKGGGDSNDGEYPDSGARLRLSSPQEELPHQTQL